MTLKARFIYMEPLMLPQWPQTGPSFSLGDS